MSVGIKKDKVHNEFITEIKNTINNKHSLNLDRRVVDLIATHPFLFTVEVMRDPKDYKAIRHRYLCIIAIMGDRKKKVLQDNVTTN